MKYGKLIYDNESDRLDIFFDDGTFYGGMHCGTVIEVNYNKEWKSTRVELSSDDWILTGLYTAGNIPSDLRVRILR